MYSIVEFEKVMEKERCDRKGQRERERESHSQYNRVIMSHVKISESAGQLVLLETSTKAVGQLDTAQNERAFF